MLTVSRSKNTRLNNKSGLLNCNHAKLKKIHNNTHTQLPNKLKSM